MTSTSTPHHGKWGNSPKSHFKQAAANDYQGSRLAVAGFSFREKQAMRVFSSAPIHKRYDVVTLETSDGICVILKGFMNKARTMENGFPSDVCEHFVFGFPPYWKDYDEKFIHKESSSGNILGVNCHRLPPQSEAEAGGQLYEDIHKNILGSQDRMDAKDLGKHRKTVSTQVQFPQTSDSVVSEDNLLSMLSTVCTVGGQDSYSKVRPFEDQYSLKMPLDIPKRTRKSLRNLNVGIKPNTSAIKDKDVDDLQINNSGRILSQYHSSESSRRKRAEEVKRGKKNLLANLDSKMNLSGDVRTEGRMTRKQKSNNKTAKTSGVEMAGLNSLSSVGAEKVGSGSADCVLGGRNRWHSEGGGLRRITVKEKQTKTETTPIEDEFKQNFEAPRLNEDKKMVKTEGSKQKEKCKLTRHLNAHAAAADDHRKKATVDESYLSENAKASGLKTGRMAYETPVTGKDSSSMFLGFRRSRSGRLLMPTLEFWRNQRAIYNVDRTVTGIQECINLEELRKGSISDPPRKRRNIT